MTAMGSENDYSCGNKHLRRNHTYSQSVRMCVYLLMMEIPYFVNT